MNKKWLILITILMLAGVLVSGCTDNQSEDTTEAQAEENVDEQTEAAAEDEEVAVVGEGEEYAVRMEYYGFVPAETEIRRGDIIVWRNYNRQVVYTLVSDDGLFEDQEMKFGNMYNYAFTESGTYTFSIKDVPDMTLTVTVV